MCVREIESLHVSMCVWERERESAMGEWAVSVQQRLQEWKVPVPNKEKSRPPKKTKSASFPNEMLLGDGGSRSSRRRRRRWSEWKQERGEAPNATTSSGRVVSLGLSLALYETSQRSADGRNANKLSQRTDRKWKLRRWWRSNGCVCEWVRALGPPAVVHHITCVKSTEYVLSTSASSAAASASSSSTSSVCAVVTWTILKAPAKKYKEKMNWNIRQKERK